MLQELSPYLSWTSSLALVSQTGKLLHPEVIKVNAALTYTEYPLQILKFEIRAEITEYDANGRGGACTKRCLCESVKNACGSLQMS